MRVLLDTNIVGRYVEVSHGQHKIAEDAIDVLVARKDNPCLVPQVLYEFWVMSTRAINVNGLGLSPDEAMAETIRLQKLFPLLGDPADLFDEWLRLVKANQVSGKNAHDARLVAAMNLHALSHLLTFNGQDFVRFSGITVLDPRTLLQAPTP